MTNVSRETIFALASGVGRAGVAVIRISGPAASDVLRRLAGALPEPRLATLQSLRDSFGDVIDRGLILWFPGPASFTGEDCAELHIHGGSALIARLLSVLAGMEGLRLAEPGEFTRRAFDNDKLDLTQVEGLADLIEAQTEGQRRLATAQMSGSLGKKCREWVDDLTKAAAYLVAAIDFADEDLPDTTVATGLAYVRPVAAQMRDALAAAPLGERIRTGYRVALLGAPNAGKSTLLNALASREVAITSEIAGTTRDSIEVALDLAGIPVTLIDTAGLREPGDTIEQLGIERSRQMAESADVRIFLTAPDAPLTKDILQLRQVGDIDFINKADLPQSIKSGALAGSALYGQGLDSLIAALTLALGQSASDPAALLISRQRQRHTIEDGLEALQRVLAHQEDSAHFELYPELVAEDLRIALDALGRVTGSVGVEDFLDIVFSEFCLGK